MKRNLELIFIALSVISTGGCYVGAHYPYSYDWPVYYRGNARYGSSVQPYECPALDSACNAEIGRQRGTARALAEQTQSAAVRAEQKAYCVAGGLECGKGQELEGY